MSGGGIPYSLEDYDAFLSSFNPKEQLLEDPQLQVMSNPSISTSFSTDEDELAMQFDFDPSQQQQQQQHLQSGLLMSPYSSNSSINQFPNYRNDEFNLNSLDQTLDQSIIQNQQQQQQFNPNFQFNNEFKRESVTSVSSIEKHSDSDSLSSGSNSPHTQIHQQQRNQKVKLSKAVPHQGSISKKNAKKEKTSHNDIERKYRTNINDKIKALRNSVPALRVLVDSGDEELDDQLDGLQPAKKLNKATILSKATEYIKHLEAKNELLRKENDSLKLKLNEVGISYSSSTSPLDETDSRIFEDQSHQSSNKKSTTNKLLLGGLAYMVGSGLTEDFSNNDSRSLFALPVLSYDKISGFQSFNKTFFILLKIGLVFTVLLNLIFPSLFNKKDKKQISSETLQVDDVRNLKQTSIWSTFFISKSNNDYIKTSIFKAIWLKVHFNNSNILTKSIIQVYVDHLWTYLQKIRLDSNNQDYENLKLILSLPINESINNEKYILKFLNYEKLLITSLNQDSSLTSLFTQMINESITNSTLKKFIFQSVESKNSYDIIEISQNLVNETDEQNLELQTLLNPNDLKIDLFKSTLDTINVSKVSTDEILILYASIIQNLVYNKRNFIKAKHWFTKLDLTESKDFSLLGFTSLYMIVIAMTSNKALYSHDKDISFKLEELSGLLRIWVGNSNGAILNFKKRSLLIDYFVNVGLKLNGLDEQIEC